MKLNYLTGFALLSLVACNSPAEKKKDQSLNIQGTWQLVSATTTQNGKSEVTDYTAKLKMIKMFNDTHFAFLKHSTNPKDTADFDAGGGTFKLDKDNYSEHLEYYKNKNWEGNTFNFKLSIKGDTLIQQGVEKVEGEGVDRVITEKYIKVK